MTEPVYPESPTAGLTGLLTREGAVNRYINAHTLTDLSRQMLPSDHNLDAVLVAASTAPVAVKSIADYVCDGTNDEAQIVAAYQNAYDEGRYVLLTDGTFNWDAMPASSGVWNGTAWTAGVRITSVSGSRKTKIQMAVGLTTCLQWTGSATTIGGTSGAITSISGSYILNTAANQTTNLPARTKFILNSTEDWTTRSYYDMGEWCEVESVGSGAVTLKQALRFAYSSISVLQISKVSLVSGVLIEGIEVAAHDSSTIQQQPIIVTYADRPRLVDVKVSGVKATIGIQFDLCYRPRTERCFCYRILDTSVSSGMLGYGIQTQGCYEWVDLDTEYEECRHGPDDSSLQRRPPSLRTKLIRPKVRNCRAAGISTHEASDEFECIDPIVENCGGAFIMRGRAWKIHRAIVHGTHASAYEYSATESTQHVLWIGAPQPGGGFDSAVVCQGGKDFYCSFADVDISGAPASTHIVYGEPNTPIDSGIILVSGKVRGHTSCAMNFVGPTVDNFDIVGDGGEIITATSNANVIIQFLPTVGALNRQKRVTVDGVRFNGFSNKLVSFNGSNASGAGEGGELGVFRCKAYNPNTSTTTLITCNSGYFSTLAGSVRVQDNDFRDSSCTTTLTTASATQAPGATVKGNLVPAGYDTAP